ncbi:Alcohol acetyltransferase [Metarhizium album ARSEF 1941]|uniref:Alcohol acetyltransferase n=1 Tax=Metarhizium album (strain ARSEF 1941) TaxID=1081103 RepID=A0A0B2WT16_METAS|nr:Alcohol acetyltransferase [Metarhizium album ARSEF 1941]KHN96110.1 Alcohol acetyltransferase [Metarhizium album ARSEF 1941]
MRLYLCVTVTSRYNAPAPGQEIDAALLYPALARVVSAQPMLKVGISKQDTNEAAFCHVKAINLANHVSFKTLEASCETLDQYNDHIASQQGWHHSQAWLNIEDTPPWRVAVIKPSPTAPRALSNIQDIIFSFHHALLDGTSGKLFHERLLEELNHQLQQRPANTTNTTNTTSSLHFPDAPKLPEAQDQIVDFSNSPLYLAKALWNQLAPARLRGKKPVPWHSKPIDFSIPYVTLTKAVDFQGPVVAKLLKACRLHNTTITGLFHALTAASLCARLPAAKTSSFVATTPISLRPFLGPSADPEFKHSLRVLVTAHEHELPAPLIDHLRTSKSPDQDIWGIAQQVKQDLNTRLASLPRDDVGGLMKYNSDWLGFFHKKHGQPRPASWEVSNIGVFKTASGPGFTVSRMYFTNGAMVTGSPLSLGLASVSGGPLTVALSWQESVVDQALMDGLAGDLARSVTRFNDTGEFGAMG